MRPWPEGPREARVHQNIRANFLMSPPLVVAFALAGTVDIDLSSEPLGKPSYFRHWINMELARGGTAFCGWQVGQR